MSGESQLTFDDVMQTDTPDELYELVSGVADALVDEERERAGDNCATLSQRQTDVADETVFCVQLPPRTDSFSVSEIEDADEGLGLSFVESTVDSNDDPPFVVWEFVGDHSSVETLRLIIVKPIEVIEEVDEDDEEESRELYTQFDFTRFVRETDSES